MERRTRDDWHEDVVEWMASGLSCAEYAEEAGLNPKSLSWWKWRLRTQGVALDAPAARPEPKNDALPLFVELAATVMPAADASRIELVCGEAVVRVPDDFAQETLCRLLDTLEARR